MTTCTGCNREFSHIGAHRKTCAAYQRSISGTRSRIQANAANNASEVSGASETKAQRRARLMGSKSGHMPGQTDASQLADPVITQASTIPVEEPSIVDDSMPPQLDLDELDDPMDAPTAMESRLPTRRHRLPLRFEDVLPQTTQPTVSPFSTQSTATRIRLIVRDTISTNYNVFGIRRLYMHRPSYDPDAFLSPEDLVVLPRRLSPSDAPSHIPIPSAPLPSAPPSNTPLPNSAPAPPLAQTQAPWPLSNWSKWLLMGWMNNGNVSKSASDIDRLVHNVLLHPDFNVEDLQGFRCETENAHLDRAAETSDNPLFQSFKEATVHIDVPSGEAGVDSQQFPVSGLLYRKLTDLITAAFQEPLAFRMHLSPHRVFHRSPGATEDIRVYGEMYTSDVFLEADDDVRLRGKLPFGEEGCTLEKIIAAVMLFSDATHLASFGNAKAWPIYLALANLSKYVRAKPTSDSMFHLAYVPSLPDSFQDWVAERFPRWGKSKSAAKELKTFCRRELMHAVWELLLDDDFVHAYTYGIVIECQDGVKRRVYPRIFTYSADYPEKVLLATIRDKGSCPCPRCMVPKNKVDLMGQKRDGANRIKQAREYLVEKVKIARDAIYRLGRAITGTAVEALLKESSQVPTMNAFIKRLGTSFNPFKMLVVDQLHEIELGVWKSLFVHCVRILHAHFKKSKEDVVSELDKRYRLIKSFGRGTIRKFSANSSEMKKLAARDFEDLLQCAIPAFEGLLPEPYNTKLMTLLYRFAEWHALGKLRMHTDTTLSWFEKSTTIIGALLRDFRDKFCPEFETFELPREAAARGRAAQQRHDAQGGATSVSDAATAKSGTRRKVFNLVTYKFHSMGDYVSHVRLFGTMDSFSTQMGELAHRTVKAFYGLTNKKDGAMMQIAKKYSRSRALKQMTADVTTAPVSAEQIAAAAASISDHHFISDNINKPIDVFNFVLESTDPAKKRFIPKLKDHLLGRFRGHDFDGDETQFTDADRNTVQLVNNKIFQHQLMRVNYTTYDILRDYDTINPNSQCFVMLKSPDDEPGAHPYWYAQVIGIYHANVQHRGPESMGPRPHKMHFLYVRWLGWEVGWKSGRRYARLPKIGYVPEEDPYAFGFLDPSLVIRGTHLIPSFVNGRTENLLSTKDTTLARPNSMDTDDWTNYYVNIFVDRDMVMRHFGGGIGHVNTLRVQPDEDEPIDEPMDEDADEEMEQDKDNDSESDEDSDEDTSDVDLDDDELDDGPSDVEDDGYDDL